MRLNHRVPDDKVNLFQREVGRQECPECLLFAHRGDVPQPGLPALPVAVDARPVRGEASALPAVQGELALAPQHAAPQHEMHAP